MPEKPKGKFWAPVRAMIWQKAQELYQMDQARGMKDDFKGFTAERQELREGGYFYRAKLIVLRNLWLQKKGLPSLEEQQYDSRDAYTIFLYVILLTTNRDKI